MTHTAAADFQLELRGFVRQWLDSTDRLLSTIEVVGNMEIIKMEVLIDALELPDPKQDGPSPEEEEEEKCP